MPDPDQHISPIMAQMASEFAEQQKKELNEPGKVREVMAKIAAAEAATTLLPVNQRVVHFREAKHGHGLGTIVAYNGVREQPYLKERFGEAVEMAGEAGLLGGLVTSMLDGNRCPYVVQWDNGYKDVYEHSSVTPYDPNNPDHDPGPQVKIRAQCGGLEESMKTAALVRATIEDIMFYFRRRGTCGDNDKVEVSPYVTNDHRIDWKETHVVTVNGNAVGFIDGNVQ